MSFIWFIIIGALAGFIAGKLTQGGGFGLVINLVVGIIGGLLGGFVFGLFGFHTTNIIGSLITSVVGAVIFLWIISLFKRKKE
ncbi:MAG: GlsB/YeaQ/YmgE family stress response membrane protein [Bacteroidales bacterium]